MEEYGYDSYFKRSFASLAEVGDMPARVIEEQRDRYRIAYRVAGQGIVEAAAVASTALRQEASSSAEMPAVGDWVAVRATPRATPDATPGDARDGPLFIRRVLPRAGAFVRKAPGDVAHDRIEAQVVAANVDYAFIVAAAGADWKPRGVERYVALALAANAQPVLVLTKADLAADPGRLLAEAEVAAPEARTALICAPAGLGLGELSFALAPGRTVVLIGSSGAGKSTLLNALAGEALAGPARSGRTTRGAGTRRRAAGCTDSSKGLSSSTRPGFVSSSFGPTKRPRALPSPRLRSWPRSAGSAIAATRASPAARCARRSRRASSTRGVIPAGTS